MAFLLDPLSAVMLLVVTGVGSLIHVFSMGYMRDDKAYWRYFAYLNLFMFSMLMLILGKNLLVLFIGWEGVGLCSYLLIGFFYTKPSAAKAALKAFWVTKFADMGLLLGLVYMGSTVGSFAWDGVGAEHATIVAALLLVGVMGKSAQFPLHVWLPDAMEGPTPVSALLHAATMVAAGVFLIVRAWPIFELAPDVLLFMAYLGAITAFCAACMACVQDDIKKVLAYSTCSQLGYMVAGLGAGSVMAGYFHLTTHAFFKALLFLAAGSVIHAVHSNSIFDMGGLFKRMKWTSALFIIGSLALAGVPVFAGYMSKDLILEATLHHNLYGPFVLLAAAAFLTAFYMGRVVFIAFFGAPSEAVLKAEEHNHGHLHEGNLLVLAMLPLGVLSVIGGFYGPDLAQAWQGVTGDLHYELHLVSTVGIVGASLALLGIVFAYLRFGRSQLTGVTGAFKPVGQFILSGPIDALIERGWRSVLLCSARAIAWFDRYVVDGFINLAGYAALVGGQKIRRFQTGRAPDYVFAVATGVLLILAWGATGGLR